MHTPTRWLAFSLAICLGLASAAVASSTKKKATRLLQLIKQVDGAGSGLDADTGPQCERR